MTESENELLGEIARLRAEVERLTENLAVNSGQLMAAREHKKLAQRERDEAFENAKRANSDAEQAERERDEARAALREREDEVTQDAEALRIVTREKAEAERERDEALERWESRNKDVDRLGGDLFALVRERDEAREERDAACADLVRVTHRLALMAAVDATVALDGDGPIDYSYTHPADKCVECRQGHCPLAVAEEQIRRLRESLADEQALTDRLAEALRRAVPDVSGFEGADGVVGEVVADFRHALEALAAHTERRKGGGE